MTRAASRKSLPGQRRRVGDISQNDDKCACGCSRWEGGEESMGGLQVLRRSGTGRWGSCIRGDL